jgi:hypothetical protein
MRKAFVGLAAVLMAVVTVQFFLAGSGALNPEPNSEAFAPHRVVGYLIVLLSLLLTVLAAAVRLPGRVVGLAGLVLGLSILQPVIAVVAKAFGEGDITTTTGQLVFGLHAVNGVAIMIVIRNIFKQGRELTTTGQTTRAGARAGSPAAGSAHSAS